MKLSERREFESWFYSSKYAQVKLPSDSDLQIAWDAWQAATEKSDAVISSLRDRIKSLAAR